MCGSMGVWQTSNLRRLRLGEEKQEGQHPLTGQRAANFRLLTN